MGSLKWGYPRGLNMIARVSWIAAAALAPLTLYAQHPYADARNYLRTAQLIMRMQQQPNVQLTLRPADDQIAAAIREIDQAGVLTRSDLRQSPVIDVNTPTLQRFASMVDLLRTARFEILEEQRNAPGAEWQIAALKHIDAALRDVHHAAIKEFLDRQIDSY